MFIISQAKEVQWFLGIHLLHESLQSLQSDAPNAVSSKLSAYNSISHD